MDQEWMELVEMVRNGASNDEIVQMFGGGTIYILKPGKQQRNQEIRNAYQSGVSVKRLVRRYNLSSSHIYAIIRQESC